MSGIEYPATSDVKARHQVLLVTLGGASASLGADDIASLATCFTQPKKPFHDPSVLGVVGHARAGGTLAPVIARRLDELCTVMAEQAGVKPLLIFVGKSLGGCRLHAVSELFATRYHYDIDMFVSVDVSCWPWRHFQRFQRTKKKRHARIYGAHVKQLYNFYQAIDSLQTGHPALRPGEDDFSRAINFDVNADPVRVDPQGNIVVESGQPPLCTAADHGTIDTCPSLLKGIKRMIRKRIAEV